MSRKRGLGLTVLPLVLTVGIARAQVQVEVDSDHDGLSDVREQALLERFVPRFQVSRTDCAVKPALFEEGLLKPTVMERDGTIYGQVTPRENAVGGDAVVEIHFYDLWSVDCGRMGHPLDAEHVSVLLQAKNMDSPVEDWKLCTGSRRRMRGRFAMRVRWRRRRCLTPRGRVLRCGSLLVSMGRF